MSEMLTPEMEDNLTGTRRIRIAVELMDELATRDIDGNRLRVEWGEPDNEGFYKPVIHVDFTDNPQKARIEELEKSRWWAKMGRGDVAAELSATFDINLDLAMQIADWILDAGKEE